MKKINIPHTYTLIFGLIIVVSLLTYLLPSGEFDRTKDVNTKNTIVVANSFHLVTNNPQGIQAVLQAPIKGIKEASTIIGFVLVVGGSFGILSATGAIEAGLRKAVEKLRHRAFLIIPVGMILFSLGGTLYGMCEETLPFFMIIIPLALALGYDSLTGFMIVYLGATVGVAASTINPFMVGIAQALCELPPGSGFEFRIVQYIIFISVAIAYVMLYAYRVKHNPEKSLVYSIDNQNKPYFLGHLNDANEATFTKKHGAIIMIFVIGLCIIVWGLVVKKWYIEEVSMVFLGSGLIAGAISGIGQNKMAQAFVGGVRDMAYAAFIIGLTRGVLVIAQDGKIIDTVLNSAVATLQGLPKPVFTTAMLFVQSCIAVLVPSTSGQAALTMPLMAPLGDLVRVNRQVVVTAYQYGNGITHWITPTAGTLMAALGIARIPWNIWAKCVLPLCVILWIIAAIFLIIGL
jgi:uncharacterized ion transporter superfamily protein YfcC